MKLSTWLLALIMCQGLSSPTLAQTNTYPIKPVVLVNPYATGGPTDLLGRTLAKGLAEQLGQQVLVENRAGGGASIGAAYVAKAAPDGYTLLLGTSAAHVVTPMATSVPYDGIKGFEFIGIVGNVPNILTVHNSMKLDALKDFLALAKSQPGKLSYASAGMGSSPHIGAELLKYRGGIDLVHIPYRGAGPALNDLVGGQVKVMFDVLGSSLQFVKAERLVPLAVTSNVRSPSLPNVPTMAEAGLPGFETTAWHGIAVRAGTPEPIIAKLNTTLNAIFKDPVFRKKWEELGTPVVAGSAEQFGQLIRAESVRLGQVVRDSGATED